LYRHQDGQADQLHKPIDARGHVITAYNREYSNGGNRNELQALYSAGSISDDAAPDRAAGGP
jgi:hypothetical protein